MIFFREFTFPRVRATFLHILSYMIDRFAVVYVWTGFINYFLKWPENWHKTQLNKKYYILCSFWRHCKQKCNTELRTYFLPIHYLNVETWNYFAMILHMMIYTEYHILLENIRIRLQLLHDWTSFRKWTSNIVALKLTKRSNQAIVFDAEKNYSEYFCCILTN